MMIVLAGLEALEDLDLAQARGADAHGASLGESVVDDVGEAPAARIEERSALHLERVRLLLEDDAHGNALVLSQPLGHRVVEADATLHLVLLHLGRDRRDVRRVLVLAEAHFGGEPEREVVAVGLRHEHLDLERRQVDDGHERRVAHDGRLLVHRARADHAVDGRAYRQAVDLPLELRHQQALPVAIETERLQLEGEALALEARVLERMLVLEAGALQIVLGLLVVALADDLLHAATSRRGAARAPRPPRSPPARSRGLPVAQLLRLLLDGAPLQASLAGLDR